MTRGDSRRAAGLRRAGPRVSVIIPVRNGERWLAEALDSVLTQSYEPLEVVVVDNGSTDNTWSVAERYDGVRAVHVPQAGAGRARNRGLEETTGELVLFLDGDDVLLPGKIARQVGVLEHTGADAAWEPYQSYHRSADGDRETYVPGAVIHPVIGDDVPASLLTAKGWLQIGSVLMRRRAIGDLRFDPHPMSLEDARFVLDLSCRGARFVSSGNEPGLLYRQHDGPRLSRRPTAAFARACAANALDAHALWVAAGTLTEERRAAVVESLLVAARRLRAVDEDAFREVARRLAEIDPEFDRALPRRLRWVARVIGYARAESVALRYRSLKTLLVHASGGAP